MKTKPIIGLAFTTLLALSLVLTGCQKPAPGAPEPPPEATEIVLDPTEEPVSPEIEPTATEAVEPTEEVVDDPTEEPTEEVAAPTEEAIPTEEVAEEPSETAAFSPLPQDDCTHMGDLLSTALGTPFITSEVPFSDFLSGESGQGCAIQATGDGKVFSSQGDVARAVEQQLTAEGWAADIQYAADGPTGTVVGFRKLDGLCVLDASWTPSDESLCAADEPISNCELAPEQKLFDVALTCAQQGGEVAEMSADDSGMVGAAETPATGTLPEATVQAPAPPMPRPENAQIIEVSRDGTPLSIQDGVRDGEVDVFALRACADDMMIVELATPKGNAFITIWGADGGVLVSDRSQARNWSGRLPADQEYFISVAAVANTSTSYVLTVKITHEEQAQPVPEDVPCARIEFAPGMDAATIVGIIPVHEYSRFVFNGLAQQAASINVISSANNAYLAIWGDDGVVLLPDAAGNNSWNGMLPITQDYYIDVIAAADIPADFTLQVTLPSMPVALSESTAERISFATGNVSVTEEGTVQAGGTTRYLVGAMAMQTMSVNVTSPDASAILVITGANGSVLLAPESAATSWTGALPASQDYIIDVISTGAAPANYSLQVSVPPL